MRKVCVIGDCSVDIYYGEKNVQYIGGNGVNVSVSLVNNGVEKVTFIGAVGNDLYGHQVRETLLRCSIDIDNLRNESGSTGWTKILINEGDRVFIDENIGSQNYFNLSEHDIQKIIQNKYTLIHYTGFTNWVSVVSDRKRYSAYIENQLISLKNTGVEISMDFSDNIDEEFYKMCSSYVSIAFCSLNESSIESYESILKKLYQYGFKIAVVMMGQHGSAAIYKDRIFTQNAIDIPVVDTLGAGDAFIGAFLASYSQRDPIDKSLSNASNYAAVICAKEGPF